MGEPRSKSSSSESPKKLAQSDYMEIRSLIAEINNGETADGYNPLPCAQHQWHMDLEGTTPLQRLWGWMVNHTVALGHRTAYATSKRVWDEDRQRWVPGHELHISNVVRDLGGDAGNWYRTWRNGVRRGIFRNGTEDEGPERMYLTGKVPKRANKETSGAHPISGDWPAHVYKYIDDWTQEKIDRFRKIMQEPERAEKLLQATAIQSVRDAKREWQDSILQEFGIPPNRQEHEKKETQEQRAARLACLAALRPAIQHCVQTVREYVQTLPFDTVQPENAPVSLLPLQSNSEKKMSRSVEPLPSSRKKTHQDGAKSQTHKQLPALPTSPLTAEEKQAEQRIYAEVASMQESFKHMPFANERISAKRKNDQLFAYRVLALIGPEYVDQFLQKAWGQLKNLDKNAFGKMPGRAPAPRSLGLILDMAIHYADELDEAARLSQESQEEWQRRQWKACKEILADPTETAEAKYVAKKLLEGASRSPDQVA